MMNTAPLKIPWKPLYPSQRSGTPTIERAFWQGEERRFIVQWHEDRAYSGLCDGESSVWATLEECAEDDAVACFEDALQSRRYGVCFSNNTKIRFGKEYFWWNLQFIYAPDGMGLLREWSSRDWIAFAPEETRMWALFPDVELPQKERGGESFKCCQYAAIDVRDDLLFRKVGEEEIERLSWRSSTNQADFERVVRLLWLSRLTTVQDKAKTWTSIYMGTNYTDSMRRNKLFLSGMDWEGNEHFLKWLQSYFSSEGFGWMPTNWGKRRYRRLRAREPRLRAFFAPHGINWQVSFANQSQPSFHEQLEARLELREWLRDKVSAEQIENWLQT